MTSKSDAIYEAFCETVSYTKEPVKVQVEEGKDEFGEFVRVHYNDKKSSKLRYNEEL